MSKISESMSVLYDLWSCEFRTGVITEQMSPQYISHLSCRLREAMSEEVIRITRVVNIVPVDVDLILDSRTCLRALRRAGIFTAG